MNMDGDDDDDDILCDDDDDDDYDDDNNPKDDIGRLYVKRKEGGRGLVQVEAAYKTEIINIAEYFNTNYKKRPVCKHC
jgi:hypothetical protein